MNSFWSDNIQGIYTLYLSRKLRFDDVFKEQWQSLFSIDKNKHIKILEIGCGPGALAESLKRWYPNASIYAIDLDTNFIRFAKEHNKDIQFMEGNAKNLPFEDGVFDLTISNTVSEHIEPSAFYGEQRRVLKKGGICIVISSRHKKGIYHMAGCLDITEEEKAFWESIEDDMIEQYGIGKYNVDEQELPKMMEEYGFINISTGYTIVDLTPDDPKYDANLAEEMIEAERLGSVEAVISTKDDRADAIIEIVNNKYKKRLDLYQNQIKQWDTNTSVNMIVKGQKR